MTNRRLREWDGHGSLSGDEVLAVDEDGADESTQVDLDVVAQYIADRIEIPEPGDGIETSIDWAYWYTACALGRWVVTRTWNAESFQTPVQDRLWLYPIPVRSTFTVADLGVLLGGDEPSAGAEIRGGIFNQLGEVLVDSGPVDVEGSSGDVVLTVNRELTPGQYLLGVCSQGEPDTAPQWTAHSGGGSYYDWQLASIARSASSAHSGLFLNSVPGEFSDLTLSDLATDRNCPQVAYRPATPVQLPE